MGMYDIFVCGKEREQLKCFDCDLDEYRCGDIVPVRRFAFPDNCTFAAWGGNPDSSYKEINLIGEEEIMGRFVVIKDRKLVKITTELSEIIKPVYSKYGNLLEAKEE